MALMNQSLASALGRPDLAFRAAQSPQATGTPYLTSSVVGADNSSVPALVGRGPTVGLMLLIIAVGGFAYWVHPRLA